MAMREWDIAESPNYGTNVDKVYPYSEVPFIGQYKLVKIPQGQGLIELVDYWGEGRINSTAGVSGFPDCYNVNHPSQCVSNGPDRGKKIPNRVPVRSYTHCDTTSYIKDSSVKNVTVMSAPINNSCAADIARMVHPQLGRVVVFGFSDSSADLANLHKELKVKNLVRCDGYYLPESLRGLTLYDTINNPNDSKVILRNYVLNSKFNDAVRLCKEFSFSNYSNTINDVVTELILQKNRKVMDFAYRLWNDGGQRVVAKYFPKIFEKVMNEKDVKIISKIRSQALKLAVDMDRDRDRMAWGDVSDKSSQRVKWRFMPIWRDGSVTFKLMNVDCGMFLKLAAYTDSYKDREAWGAFGSSTNRHCWYLDPVMLNGELLFFVVNKEYGLGLKLDANPDSAGDRQLWGHNSSVHNDPEYFGWRID
uniref:Microvitellogenin n=1 Tax=Maruca vitrata TaxID=497515 RepID=A0A385HW64_MARVT|nr:microvitellogenin [Maruca vitrata]